MKTVSLFSLLLKQTKTVRYLVSFLIAFLICSLLMWMLDPSIETFGDAIWFGFMLVTTTGFGDLTVRTPAARLVAVFLGLYGVLTIGFICGVGASWLFEKVREGKNDSVAMMLYQLEHLDELSDEQIQALQTRISHIQQASENGPSSASSRTTENTRS